MYFNCIDYFFFENFLNTSKIVLEMKTELPQDFFIDLKQYHIIDKLSDGAFTQTFLVEDDKSNKYLAVESTNKSLFPLETIKNQVEKKYISILNPIGYSKTNFNEEDFPVLLYDYKSNGSLSSFIACNSIDRISGTKRFIILLGIAYAMRFLHFNYHIAYTFLHPDNIYLDEDLNPYLIFLPPNPIPQAELVKSYLSTSPKLPLYLSPEILRHEPFNHKADLYSFSLIVYHLISFHVPYESILNKGTKFFIEKVINGHHSNYDYLPKGKVRKMMETCWRMNPKDRKNFDWILKTMMRSPFSRYFEIKGNKVAKYLQKFGREANISLTMLHFNNDPLDEDEVLTLANLINKTPEEVLALNLELENKLLNMPDLGEKNFDKIVDQAMRNGEKRRFNEIYVYVQDKNNSFTDQQLMFLMKYKKKDDEKKVMTNQSITDV